MIALLTILIPALILSLPIFNLSIIAGIIYLFILVISFGIGTNFQTLCLGKKSRLSPIFSHWVGICTSSVILSISFYLKIPAWIILILLTLWSATGFIRIFQPININSTDKIARSEIFPILLCSLVSVIWCIHEFQGLHFDGSVYKFTPWLDNFYHAVWVDEFSRYIKGFEPNDPRASGVPTFLYHIGQYAIPSLVYTFQPSISSIDYYIRISTPLAFFIVGGAGYSLCNRVRNRRAATITLIFLLCIPYVDVSQLRTGWFNFYWLLLVHPSLGFGIAAAAFVWINLFSINKYTHFLRILVIYCSSIFIVFLKAHILIINALSLAISPLILIKNKTKVLLTANFSVILFVGSLIANQHGLPSYKLDGSGFTNYINFISTFVTNEQFRAVLNHIANQIDQPFAYLKFMPIISYMSFGPMLFIALLLFIKQGLRYNCFTIITAISTLTYIAFATFGTLESDKYGMPEELMQRTVIWPQFLLCVLTSIYFQREINRRFIKYLNISYLLKPSILKSALVLLLLVTIPLIENSSTLKSVNIGLTDKILPTGLIDISLKLKKISKFNEIFLDTDGDPDHIVRSISGIRSYYFKSKLLNHRKSPLIQQRIDKMDTLFIDSEQNYTKAHIMDFIQTKKINYIVTSEGHKWSKFFLNHYDVIHKSNEHILIHIK